MKVAVTGASGFIGRHVVSALEARGTAVAPIRRPFVADALAVSLRGADAVVHLAGLVSARNDAEYFAANVESTRVVAAAALAAGVRLVHISSLAAGGPAPASAPRAEQDPPRPINGYGRSKLESERLLERSIGLRWVALRPGIVYGPGDRALLPLFRLATRRVLPVVGRADAAYSAIHVDDAVRAILAAIDSDADREPIFVAHPRPATVRAIVDGVNTATGGRAHVVRIPMALTRAAALAGDLVGAVGGRRPLINSRRYAELAAEGFVCQVDRLRERLGVVAAIDLADGLARTAAWYRKEGWIDDGARERT